MSFKKKSRQVLGQSLCFLALLFACYGTGCTPSRQAHPFGGGLGTSEDPYQITTIAHLNAIRDHSSSGGKNYLTDTFRLMNDLDFREHDYDDPDKGWLPIGHDRESSDSSSRQSDVHAFMGYFHGGGHVIHNLRITRVEENYIGLFGLVGGGARVDSLGLKDVDIEGKDYIGALAGYSAGNMEEFEYESVVERCYATGVVSGNNYVGGFVGSIGDFAGISDSYSAGMVLGNNYVGGLVGACSAEWYGMMIGGNYVSNSYSTGVVLGNNYVGGLVGSIDGYANLSDSYSTGTVSGNRNVGGLLGSIDGPADLSDSYSTGTVSGNRNVGGLVGSADFICSIRNSHSTSKVSGRGNHVGGFVGWLESGVELWEYGPGVKNNNYWNTETSGHTVGIGSGSTTDPDVHIAGLTTAQMYSAGAFNGFDFEEDKQVWLMPVSTGNKVFPRLRGAPRHGQTLSMPALPFKRVGENFTLEGYRFLSPVRIEGSTYSFSSANEAVARVDANTGAVTIVGLGVAMLSITRTGNDEYAPGSASTLLRVVPHAVTLEGEGTAAAPFQIRTLHELNAIRGSLLADTFELMGDLDFSDIDGKGTDYAYKDMEKGWLPIGHDTDADSIDFQGTRFTGSFHGNGYVIRNFYITRMQQEYVGLFGALGAGGRIERLGVEDVDVAGRDVVGALVGESEDGSTITHSYSTGNVSGIGYAMGGLVGVNNGILMNSHSAVDISEHLDFGAAAGGLVGVNSVSGLIRDCYSTGTLSCKGSSDASVGGLVGSNNGGRVFRCYSAGRTRGPNAGALVGANARLSGFYVHSSVENSYWNAATARAKTAIGRDDGIMENVMGLTTEQMYEQASFGVLDFTTIWIPPNAAEQRFPTLREVGGQGTEKIQH